MALDRELAFKGGRDYLHSTTVFDDILALRGGDASGIDFRFNHRTAHAVRYQAQAPGEGEVAVGSWRDDAGTLHVVERPDLIQARQPYDEDALAATFEYGDRSVAVPADLGGHSAIEAVVAGFKALLLRSVAQPGARLAFVRIRLPRAPRTPLQIRYSRRIGEFYQGDLSEDGQAAGQLWFGAWR